MKYLVDSDYVVDYLKGRSAAVTLLDDLFSDGLAISIITFAEVYEMLEGHPRRYLVLFNVDVLGINETIAKEFARIRGDLRARGELLPHPDVFIAATALYYDLTLLTRNIKHFERISDLSLKTQ